MKKIMLGLLLVISGAPAIAQDFGNYFSNSQYYSPPRNMSKYYYDARFGGDGIPVSLTPYNIRPDAYYASGGRDFDRNMLYDQSLAYDQERWYRQNQNQGSYQYPRQYNRYRPYQDYSDGYSDGSYQQSYRPRYRSYRPQQQLWQGYDYSQSFMPGGCYGPSYNQYDPYRYANYQQVVYRRKTYRRIVRY